MTQTDRHVESHYVQSSSKVVQPPTIMTTTLYVKQNQQWWRITLAQNPWSLQQHYSRITRLLSLTVHTWRENQATVITLLFQSSSETLVDFKTLHFYEISSQHKLKLSEEFRKRMLCMLFGKCRRKCAHKLSLYTDNAEPNEVRDS